MAKNLTDLTARTATADSDLIHVNSGGTDYKETKQNFLQGDFYHTFANDTLLTTQADSLATGRYFGTIASYGHQSETGVPVNTSFYVHLINYGGNYKIIYLTRQATGDVYFKVKASGTWQSDWTQEPTRTELTNLAQCYPLASCYKNSWQTNGGAYYGKIGNIGWVQCAARNGTLNSVVFTLPTGFRPETAMVVPAFTAGGAANGYAYISADGNATMSSQTSTSGVYFNVMFMCAAT